MKTKQMALGQIRIKSHHVSCRGCCRYLFWWYAKHLA